MILSGGADIVFSMEQQTLTPEQTRARIEIYRERAESADYAARLAANQARQEAEK